jgi:hypothetical protein
MKDLEINIPILKSEENLNAWDVTVNRPLEIHDLDAFIKKDVQQPEGTDEDKKKWKMNCLKVATLLGASLTKQRR